MRGKVLRTSPRLALSGITPAYAGKSLTGTVWTRPPRDHPRLCGEKNFFGLCQHQYLGSPPPMRGKVVPSGCFGFWSRITPAYAGKSTSDTVKGFIKGDHPRLCGEKTKKIPKQRYFFHQPASFSFSLQYT